MFKQSASKEVREHIKELKKRGWTGPFQLSNNHNRMVWPHAPSGVDTLQFASTPSDRRWRLNSMADAKRIEQKHPAPTITTPAIPVVRQETPISQSETSKPIGCQSPGSIEGIEAHEKNGDTELCPECSSLLQKTIGWAKRYNTEKADKKTRTNTIPFDADNPDDPRHGTINAYKNLGCRCDECKQAIADYQREYYQKKTKGISTRRYDTATFDPNDPDDPGHGTVKGYKKGCKCDHCKQAMNDYVKNEGKCGSPLGELRHRRNGEQPCRKCTRAKIKFDEFIESAKKNQMEVTPADRVKLMRLTKW